MITYELAKQLKEAGFPQEQSLGRCQEKDGNGWIDLPNLSELIEACGDRFIQLHNNRITKEKWVAFGKNTHCNCCHQGDNQRCEGFGLTPEEAVAKLWLKLHEHEQN